MKAKPAEKPTAEFQSRVGWKVAALALVPIMAFAAFYATEGHLGYTFILTLLTLGVISQNICPEPTPSLGEPSPGEHHE